MPSSFPAGSPAPPPTPKQIAFDNFEVNLRSGELRKNGARIRLQPQPFQLLVLLLENAGDVVTREEICRELWPGDTFVDFEHGLASAINKIRDALGDAADHPRFIETLPKRGYRFIGIIKPEPPVVLPPPHSPTAELLSPRSPKTHVQRTQLVPWLVGFTLLVAVSLAFWLSRKTASPPLTSQPMTPVPFTSYPGLEADPAVSPDGSRIAFIWDHGATTNSGSPAYDLYVKAIGSETLLRLTNHPSEWLSPAWSPDGTQVAFLRVAPPNTGIYVVPALGGPERELLATRTPYAIATPISWSPDGKWLAFTDDAKPGTDTSFLLNVETLESHQLPHNPACIHEGAPAFSHSGKQLALICVHSLNNFEYFVADNRGNSARSLATGLQFPSKIAWSADDQYLIVSQGRDLPELSQIRVSDGQVQKLPVSGPAFWPATSLDGNQLAFVTPSFHRGIWRKDLLHPQLPPVQFYTSTFQQDEARYSPDGTHVAFDSNRSGVWSVWLADSDGSNLVQLSHAGPAGYPRWSPDSRQIAFQMDEGGSAGIYIANISDRVPRKLSIPFRKAGVPAWSHDGRWIYFQAFEGVGQQIYRCPAQGGDPVFIVAADTVNEPVESSDGQTLFFMPAISRSQLQMLAVHQPGATPHSVPDMPEISAFERWAVVPTGIYFTALSSQRTVSFYDLATHKTRELFKADHVIGEGLSVSPDGRYLLYTQLDENNSNIMLVHNFH